MLTRLSKVRFISLAILIIMVLMSVSATAAAPLLASPGDVIINEIIQNPAVVVNNADFATNGGVDVAYSYGSGWYLSNSADEVVLLDVLLTEIDRVEYDGGAVFPDPTGASMALIDPALDNNVGANWCTASTPYGDGDFGTPGVENDCSVPPPPPPPLTIYNIQYIGVSIIK